MNLELVNARLLVFLVSSSDFNGANCINADLFVVVVVLIVLSVVSMIVVVMLV